MFTVLQYLLIEIFYRISVGFVCELYCESNYAIRGNGFTKCQIDGTWDNILGQCVSK